MSRFDPLFVMNECEHHVEEESGRKYAMVPDGDRIVPVWVSHMFDAAIGAYPVMGRYLLNYGKIVELADKTIEMLPFWVTKDQFKQLLKKAGRHWEAGGVEDLVSMLANLLDGLGESAMKKTNNEIVLALLKAAEGKIKEQYLNKEFLTYVVANLVRRRF
jgi:hypothetical protein